MHVLVRTAAASSLLAAFAFAQTPVVTPGSPAEAWSRFLAGRPGAWQSEWSPATGTPTDVWGPGLRLTRGEITTVAQARRLAEQVLAQYSQLLGRGPTQFIEELQTKTLKVFTFGYRQEYQGLPCIGGWVRLMINDCGVLALFGSTALPVPAGLSTSPAVGIDQARWTGYQHVGLEPPKPPVLALTTRSQDRLVVWGDVNATTRTAVRLAWEIRVKDLSKMLSGRVYVDAQTGRVLQYANDLHTCGFEHCPHDAGEWARREAAATPPVEVSYGTPVPGMTNVVGNVRGWVNTGVGPNDPRSNLPMENLKVQIVGGASGFTDTAGNFNITHPGTAAVNLNIVFSGRYCANVRTSQGTNLNLTVSATPGTPVNVQIYSQNPSQFDGAQVDAYWATDDINQFVRSLGGNPGANLDAVRATTSLAQSCNAFYTGYTINFFAAGGGCVNTAYPSVIYHEWGHGYDDASGGISQTDGLSEGSADFIAMAILNNPVVGKDFSGPGTFIRTGLNTRTFPAGGGVHQQGETWMGWSWDVYTNLTASLGSSAALALYRAFAVGQFAPNPTNQPAAVRVVFVLDDNDGNLNNGTPHCAELAAACTKRNLPNPANCSGGTPGTYTTYGLGCGSSTGTTTCPTLNPSGGTLASATSTNQTWAYRVTAASAMTVTGFQLWTRSASTSTATTTGYLYLASTTGAPASSPSASGSMLIGSGAGFYGTTLSPSVSIAAGQSFYIAVNHVGSIVSNLTAGTIGSAYFLTGTSTWTAATTTRPSYLVTCTGGGTSTGAVSLSATGVPRIGFSFTLNVGSAPPNAAGVMFFGASKTNWLGLTLPFNLTAFGAPQCSILASGEVQIGISTSASGTASLTVNVPLNASLLGKKFYNQAVVRTTQNPLGVVLSNGGEGTVGQ